MCECRVLLPEEKEEIGAYLQETSCLMLLLGRERQRRARRIQPIDGPLVKENREISSHHRRRDGNAKKAPSRIEHCVSLKNLINRYWVEHDKGQYPFFDHWEYWEQRVDREG